MVHITLLQTQKIGASWYSSFDTINLPPKTLQFLIHKLPETETAAKNALTLAIDSGDYKRNKGTLYFVPPLLIDGAKVTHIIPSTMGKNAFIEFLRIAQVQTPQNTYLIGKLEAAIASKIALEQEQVQKLELVYTQFNASEEGQHRLPIKKRKIFIDSVF